MCSLSPPSPISLYYFLQNNTPSTAKSLNSQVTSVGVQLLLHLPSMVPSMPPWLHLHLEVLHGFTFHTLKLGSFATVLILVTIAVVGTPRREQGPHLPLDVLDQTREVKPRRAAWNWTKSRWELVLGFKYFGIRFLRILFLKRKEASKQAIHRE